MIPKKIHFCWFGKNKKPELVIRCVASWKKYLVDYEIIEWNEDNFDINSNLFVKEAFCAGKWAFVSDYVRLWALYNYGGIYLDSDVEVIKSLDEFLEYPAFGGFSGAYEVTNNVEIPSAVMGAEKGNLWLKYLLDYYKDRKFILPDGAYDMVTNAAIITRMSEDLFEPNNKKQTMKLGEVELFPMEYFEPINPVNNIDVFSENSYCIHWHNCSWMTKNSSRGKILSKIIHFLKEIFGEQNCKKIKKILRK